MNCIVVIGTYNEAENIPSLLPEILRLGDDYSVIIVDDNSPDGTGKLVEEMKTDHLRIHIVHRESRLGYGTAYLEGAATIRWSKAADGRRLLPQPAGHPSPRRGC